MSENKKPNGLKFSPWWIYAALISGLIALNYFGGAGFQDTTKISYSKFNEYLNKGQIEKVIIYNKTEGEAYLTAAALKDKSNSKVAKDMLGNANKGPHYTFDIGNDEVFQNNIEKAKAEGKLKDFDFKQKSDISNIIITILPFVIIIGLWVLIMRRMSGGSGGGGGQIFNIGKSRAKLFDEKNDIKTTFKDVAGLEGAKEEIQEIVEFLKNPEKYTNLGGKIPKGALLVGPPGTGKTLLAKAVGGEAKVPFFSLSGSDFAEMFVGVGASRLRDL